MKICLLCLALLGCDRALDVPEEAPSASAGSILDLATAIGCEVCPSHSFCEFPAGSCGTTGVGGICQGEPRDCVGADSKQPECGCDQETYANSCLRQIAGVSLLHAGACANADSCQSAGGYCQGDYATFPCKSGYHLAGDPDGCGLGACCLPDN